MPHRPSPRVSPRTSPRVQRALEVFAVGVVVLAILVLFDQFAPAPFGHNGAVAFLQAGAVSTDTPVPSDTPTDTPTPIPPTPVPTATPVPPPPPTQLIFDSASGTPADTHDPTAYFMTLRFHTSPAKPDDYASFGATACGVALFAVTTAHLDASGAQSFLYTFHVSCARPFSVTISAQLLGAGQGPATYPLVGSVTFTVGN